MIILYLVQQINYSKKNKNEPGYHEPITTKAEYEANSPKDCWNMWRDYNQDTKDEKFICNYIIELSRR